jgi:dihydroorotase
MTTKKPDGESARRPPPARLLFRAARVLDPATGLEETRDVYIEHGRLATPSTVLPPETDVINAAGLYAVPGLIDLHVHLRQPGAGGADEAALAETVESGARAAAAGGFTSIVAMPNTTPPTDTVRAVRGLLGLARSAGLTQVLPSACLTKDRAGRRLANFVSLSGAGAVAFTDDGSTIEDDALMRDAMRAAASAGALVMDHAQDPAAERGGVMHEGTWSRRWGLPGIPSSAEAGAIERDMRLARETGARVHIQHLSTREGVEIVRAARARGLAVSAEVTPHHLALCDADVDPRNADFKMNPPVRSAADRDALGAAVAEGIIAAFATDHAPHRAERKATGFAEAPFGVIGLETAVGVSYTAMVRSGRMSVLEWLRRWTTGPAAILRRPPPSMAPGAPANIALLDLETPWTVDPSGFASRSRNTPFRGWTLYGRPLCTVFGGRVVWDRIGL